MKKKSSCAFAIVMLLSVKVFSIEFSDAEQQWLDHVGPLLFSEVDWEPLSYTSDSPGFRGMIADYLQILGESTGIEMVYIQSRTWQDVLDKFSTMDIDFIPALGSGDYVGAEVILTDPYISFPLVIVTRPNIDFISFTSELEGKRVGVGEGYTSYNFLKNNYPEIELVTTDNIRQGLQLLNSGIIYAFVGHMAAVMDAIKKSGFDLRIAGKTEYVFDHRIGLPPGHEQTVSIFNKVFARISPEEHNRIYNKWIRMNTDTADKSLVWKILFGSFIIISWIVYRNMRISAEKKRIERLFCDLNILKDELDVRNRELNKLAITDRLTGLYNRLKLDEALNSEVARYGRSNQPFGIILLDIDHFKFINDTYGHPTGDIVLECISRLLLSNIRKTDILGRWGGEEFLIICPETDEEGIELLAEKLRRTIDSFDFPEVHTCQASFGATLYQENNDMTQFMKRADEALYLAKKRGRNMVVFQ